jgi:hypothetical protein
MFSPLHDRAHGLPRLLDAILRQLLRLLPFVLLTRSLRSVATAATASLHSQPSLITLKKGSLVLDFLSERRLFFQKFSFFLHNCRK